MNENINDCLDSLDMRYFPDCSPCSHVLWHLTKQVSLSRSHLLHCYCLILSLLNRVMMYQQQRQRSSSLRLRLNSHLDSGVGCCHLDGIFMGGDLDRLCVPRRQHDDDDDVTNTLGILWPGTCLSRDNTLICLQIWVMSECLLLLWQGPRQDTIII